MSNHYHRISDSIHIPAKDPALSGSPAPRGLTSTPVRPLGPPWLTGGNWSPDGERLLQGLPRRPDLPPEALSAILPKPAPPGNPGTGSTMTLEDSGRNWLPWGSFSSPRAFMSRSGRINRRNARPPLWPDNSCPASLAEFILSNYGASGCDFIHLGVVHLGIVSTVA